MLNYEIIFITRQDLQLKAVETEVLALCEALEKNGSKFVNVEYCGLRPLAYPIKKNRKGHYVLFNGQINRQGLKDLNHFLYYNEKILRFFITKVDKLETTPSLLLQQSRSYIESTIRDVSTFAGQMNALKNMETEEAT